MLQGIVAPAQSRPSSCNGDIGHRSTWQRYGASKTAALAITGAIHTIAIRLQACMFVRRLVRMHVTIVVCMILRLRVDAHARRRMRMWRKAFVQDRRQQCRHGHGDAKLAQIGPKNEHGLSKSGFDYEPYHNGKVKSAYRLTLPRYPPEGQNSSPDRRAGSE
jgi:hypothetical protein